MASHDWKELERVTTRLDELRNRLDVAEDANQIAAIYALEEEINELASRFNRTRCRRSRGLVFRQLRLVRRVSGNLWPDCEIDSCHQ